MRNNLFFLITVGSKKVSFWSSGGGQRLHQTGKIWMIQLKFVNI